MKKVVVIGILIFLFSYFIRLYNFAEAGRWSDEEGYITKSYYVINFIKSGNINHPYLYLDGGDHPLLSNYIYGVVGMLDFRGLSHAYSTVVGSFIPIFDYDLFFSRQVSILLSTMSVILVFIFCVRYLNLYIAIVASLIMTLLPHYIGYSQFVGLENFVMFTFTASVVCFVLYLEKHSFKYLFLTSIFIGLSVISKQSSVLIYILIVGIYFLHKVYFKKSPSFKNLVIINFLSFLTILVLYPMPFLHLNDYLQQAYRLWFEKGGKIPEVLFGRKMGAPFPYYFIAVSITTPVLVMIASFIGGFEMLRKKGFIFYTIILWLLVPFLLSFFQAKQHMVRYIFQFYAPLSIIAAIGVFYLVNLIKVKGIKYFLPAVILMYLSTIVLQFSPYYLFYYNELVGGTKNVYNNRLFLLGWFGEGLRGPGYYLAENAVQGSRVGEAIDPAYSALFRVSYLQYSKFDPKEKYDYVVLNYYKDIRIGFDYSHLKDYEIVYQEQVAGVDVARVYKRKE